MKTTAVTRPQAVAEDVSISGTTTHCKSVINCTG